MAEDHGPPVLATVVEALVADVVADYRIDAPAARSLIETALGHDRKLRAAIAKAPDLHGLTRTRAYRDARKRARKAVYYDLRRYKRVAPVDKTPVEAVGHKKVAPVEAVETASNKRVAPVESTVGTAALDKRVAPVETASYKRVAPVETAPVLREKPAATCLAPSQVIETEDSCHAGGGTTRTAPPRDDFATLTAALRSAAAARAPDLVRRLLTAHASTRERLASRQAFDETLTRALDGPRSVLDIGCGVYPLMFPFTAASERLERYLALDRDAEAIRAVDAFARTTDQPLIARRWQLADGWHDLETIAGCPLPRRFDVALLLKVVPVVARQHAALLDVLARTPARRLVISGSRIALAKRTTIEKRERAVLLRFAARAGAEVVAEHRTDEELLMVLDRP